MGMMAPIWKFIMSFGILSVILSIVWYIDFPTDVLNLIMAYQTVWR